MPTHPDNTGEPSESIYQPHFFTGGGREAVLHQLSEAVLDGEAFLTLTGETGSGKSVLCEMLSQRIDDPILVVYLPFDLASFEEVARIIIDETGVEIPVDYSERRLGLQLEFVRSYLEEQDKRLLLIFDEAEKLYLATMERARKMLDVFNARKATTSLLFSGRPQLLDNLGRLEVVDFDHLQGVHCELEPLSTEETEEYLLHLYGADKNFAEVFSAEKIEQLTMKSKGNIGSIKRHAAQMVSQSGIIQQYGSAQPSENEYDLNHFEEVLESEHMIDPIDDSIASYEEQKVEETPFAEEAEPVDISETEDVARLQRRPVSPALRKKQKNRQSRSMLLLRITGIALLCLFIVSILYIIYLSQQPAEKGSVGVELQPTAKSLSNELPPKAAVEETKKTASTSPLASSQPQTNEEKNDSQLPTTESVVERIEKMQSTPTLSKDAASSSQSSGNVTIQKEIVIEEKAVEKSTAKEEKNDAEKTAEQELTITENYASRVAAGERMKADMQSSEYSLQIMSLQSVNAEANLQALLEQQEYQEVLGDLYILRSNTGSPIILLFGKYASVEEARQARDNLPAVLQKYKAYPVAVKNAISKM